MYLNKHHLVSSQNLDELRETLDRQFSQHDLNITQKNHEVDAVINGCSINNLALTYVSYGDEVPIEARIHEEQCSDILTLNIPVTGAGRLQQNGGDWDLSPDKGVVFSLQKPLIFNSQGCSAIALSLPIASLMKHAKAMSGDKVEQIDFKFNPIIDLASPLGKSLRNTIIYAAQEMDGPLYRLDNPIATTNLENNLLSKFIMLQPNSFMDLRQRTMNREIMPHHIKRARDYIHAYAHENITLHDLASYAGCSYRTLQTLFNKAFGLSPIMYLTMVRLERVHEALLNADYDNSTVSDIAKAWGFTHMGRLAGVYKKRYGVSPSETLREKK